MKELVITPPEGYEVDKENSTFEKIVFKEKSLKYNDICNKLFKNKEFFYTNNSGVILSSAPVVRPDLIYSSNNSLTYEQLQCILAKNKLANVAKYLNSLSNEMTATYYIYDGFKLNVQKLLEPKFNLGLIMFKTKELAQQAIQILGEEEVKLALKPLY